MFTFVLAGPSVLLPAPVDPLYCPVLKRRVVTRSVSAGKSAGNGLGVKQNKKCFDGPDGDLWSDVYQTISFRDLSADSRISTARVWTPLVPGFLPDVIACLCCGIVL